jgi:hypothetical protein
MAQEQTNTIKFKTIIFIILGLIIPLWPITLPLFWWLAYKSYKKGSDAGHSLTDLKNAKDLLENGAINQEEFNAIKEKALGR